ncbi:MAG: hypothetical protein KKB20_06290, partial [Proteobacteria bacterium]|nr:hypothetical protein [Pseudomonadota bacterium]
HQLAGRFLEHALLVGQREIHQGPPFTSCLSSFRGAGRLSPAWIVFLTVQYKINGSVSGRRRGRSAGCAHGEQPHEQVPDQNCGHPDVYLAKQAPGNAFFHKRFHFNRNYAASTTLFLFRAF